MAVAFRRAVTSRVGAALACLDHPYRVVFASRGSMAVWESLERIGNFTIVPTPLDIPRFRAHLSQIDRATARRRLGLDDEEICVLVARHGMRSQGAARSGSRLRRASSRGGPTRPLLRGRPARRLPYGRELQRLRDQLPADRRDRFTIAPETGQTALVLERCRHLLLHITDRELSSRHSRGHGMRPADRHDARVRYRRASCARR